MPRFFYGAWPSNWRELIGLLVFRAGFSPTEAWALDDQKLLFWMDQAEAIAQKEDGS